MTDPFTDAQARANEIATAHYAGMFVTMSWGGEYTDSIDVEADLRPTTTIKEMIQAVQKRLNELGAHPPLSTDGVIGPATLNAIWLVLK